MNLENNPAKIIWYALSTAFVLKMMIVPFFKQIYINHLERHYDRLKAGLKRKDNCWVDEVSAINQEWNDRRRNIATSTHKPFDCIKCMSFWLSMIIAICSGMQGESAFVGIVGLACGMFLEGIIMRWL